MRGTLEALRDGLIAASDAGATARLLTGVNTMGETLDDLRDVAAAEAGRLRLEFRDVDVGEIVTRTASYADLAARKGIALDPGSHESIVAQTDERRLTRIVANLVTNALQATPPGGRVAVGVRRHGAAVVLRVEDTAGPGAGTGDPGRARREGLRLGPARRGGPQPRRRRRACDRRRSIGRSRGDAAAALTGTSSPYDLHTRDLRCAHEHD
jgi:signal transduction histidine kinase